MNRARVVTLNAALGPLDYRVPDGMQVEPGADRQAHGAPLAALLREAGFTAVSHGPTRYPWLGYARGQAPG